ncbi:MAG: hypothetical protein BWY93_01139 [Euryarchaeota archaeon ADurb.BinA087]|nr:MAG: hypothetical protein BWY93_01139 [Euryarchaeota archaeon ADurb.BinA087]
MMISKTSRTLDDMPAVLRLNIPEGKKTGEVRIPIDIPREREQTDIPGSSPAREGGRYPLFLAPWHQRLEFCKDSPGKFRGPCSSSQVPGLYPPGDCRPDSLLNKPAGCVLSDMV